MFTFAEAMVDGLNEETSTSRAWLASEIELPMTQLKEKKRGKHKIK
jgi:hypothetical protein